MAIKSNVMYSIWTSVYLHCCYCSQNYNALQYNFKVTLPKDFSTKYKDRFIFQTLGSKLTSFEDGVHFSIANMNKGIYYIRDADLDHYYNYMKIHEGLIYWFGQELKWIINKRLSLAKYEHCPEKYFVSLDPHNLAPIVIDYRQNNLSLQTLIIFQKLFKILDKGRFDDKLYGMMMHFVKRTSTLVILGEAQKRNIHTCLHQHLLSTYPTLSNLLGI